MLKIPNRVNNAERAFVRQIEYKKAHSMFSTLK